MTTGLRRDQQRGFEIREGEVGTPELGDGVVTPAKFNSTVYGTGTTTIDPDDATSHGASSALSRTDHQHQITAAAPSSLTETQTNTEGASSSFARADHGHATDALPRGIIAQQVLTADSTALTTSAVTDWAINNVAVIQDHTYAFHLHTRALLSAAGVWNVQLRVNTTIVDRFMLVNILTPALMFDATVYWIAPTTQATDDFDVFGTEVSGTGDLTFQADSVTRRTFSIIDLGII